jgi:hypothetical protein
MPLVGKYKEYGSYLAYEMRGDEISVLVGKSIDHQLASVSDVHVPSELLWQLLLSYKLNKVSATSRLSIFTTDTEWESISLSNKTSVATGKIIERYDIPRHWFDELVCEGRNTNPVEFIPPDESRKTRRRKTWVKMQRDFSIYLYRLQGKKISEIYSLVSDEFDENLAHGNIKKIISDVRHRKLGLDDEVISF